MSPLNGIIHGFADWFIQSCVCYHSEPTTLLTQKKRHQGRNNKHNTLLNTIVDLRLSQVTMTRLPVEVIIFEILTRVPASAAIRSKSVCKQWCALLSTRDFQNLHCSRATISGNQKTLLLRSGNCYVHSIDNDTGGYGPHTIIQLPFQADIDDVLILSNLDGLLCVCLRSTHELLLWNPTTTAYTSLSTPAGYGLYEDISDTVGLYTDQSNDYKLLHIMRRRTVLSANIYSQELGVWTEIPFPTKPAYINRHFCWSPGTVCGDILYFTVCECWVGGQDAVIGFDTINERVIEIGFPSVAPTKIFQSVLLNVQDRLHMVLATGLHNLLIDMWSLQGETWVRLLTVPPVPPIPLAVWFSITHYMTNGRWFIMSDSEKLYEVAADRETSDCFYPVTWFRGYIGAVFVETLISPSF